MTDLTLADCAEIDNNAPGPFEGESGLANWYWQAILDGFGGEEFEAQDGTLYSIFEVDHDEAEAFPQEVKVGDFALVWQSDAGFIHFVAFASRKPLDSFIDGIPPGLRSAESR